MVMQTDLLDIWIEEDSKALHDGVKPKENLDEIFYLKMIEDFVEKGEIAIPADDLSNYLAEVMQDKELQAMVLLDEVRARIFKDNLMRFVDAALRRKRFNINRRQSEAKGMEETLEWSLDKKRDGEQALLDTLEKNYGEYGFRSAFYRKMFSDEKNLANEAVWESLHKEYKVVFNECIQQEQRQFVQQQAEANKKRLEQLEHTIPEYLHDHQITDEEFFQAWSMMGGEWNEYDFNRYVRLARLQQEYPNLIRLANKMGRVVDPEGMETMWVGSGHELLLDHSSKSDIQGVTFGSHLDTLLPSETVQMVDEDLQELFLTKFATSKLQEFHYRSEQLMPNRHLEQRRARKKGPMIACVDTSGSMVGKPEQIARSLILRLVDLAASQHRDLFLIAFSVSAKPIDASKDRVRLLDFFSHQASGDTDPRKMVELTLNLLHENPTYACADVVIVGDFHMGLAPVRMTDMMTQLRSQGTYFYGLQIGANPANLWIPYLDQLYSIGYIPDRRF